jgi:luciferase family oxidoreductase group 1
MPERITLSVLDQAPLMRDGTAAQALNDSIRLACACDGLGYHRFWVAEHHASNRLASPSPEILITRIAAETRSIRVGSGGVMLSHYSPFKVAENFRMLEALYPGRIDLGIGRAPGSDGLTAAALAYGNPVGIGYYPAKVADLVAFLNDERPVTDAFARLRVTPAVDTVPEIWLLASSHDSAGFAAQFGLSLSFAHFIAPETTVDALRGYRSSFRPAYMRAPRAAVGVSVLCTDDDERAELYRRLRELQRLRRERGELGPPPTLEEARDHPFTDAELDASRQRRTRQLIGNAEQVKAAIERLATDCGANEMILLTHAQSYEERVKSYALLADAFDLTPRL